MPQNLMAQIFERKNEEILSKIQNSKPLHTSPLASFTGEVIASASAQRKS